VKFQGEQQLLTSLCQKQAMHQKKKNMLPVGKYLFFFFSKSLDTSGFLLKEKKSYSSAGSSFFFFSSISPVNPVKNKFSSLSERKRTKELVF